jgi:release factor glutamine methyltransferase
LTARAFARRAQALLARGDCPDPALDARRLVEDALGTPFANLRVFGDVELSGEALKWIEGALARRLAGEPLQYIEGFSDFYGLRLLTDPRALIPRQDTETLAEAALAFAKGRAAPSVLDLCTGGGCLALAIKRALPGARVAATDLSEDALALARENAARLSLDIEFLPGDLFAPVEGRTFDVIVSNPPYLTDADMAALQREVAFEPAMALRGGADGLAFYRRIADGLATRVKPGGAVFLEVGRGQAGEVMRLFRGGRVYAVRDLPGVDRVVVYMP